MTKKFIYLITAVVILTTAFTSCKKIKDILYEKYTVTFNLNYTGSPASTTVEVYEGEKLKEPAKPTRDGWEFMGWFKNAAGTTEWNFATEVVNSEMMLYAKWLAKTFTVTFNGNGGNVTPASQTVSGGGRATQPTMQPRAGYRFDGWFRDNTTFANAWNFASDNVTDNVTLHAKWTQIFTVTFDTDGGSDAPASQTIDAGGRATKPTDPTKFRAGLYTGTVTAADVRMTFDGWYNGATEWNFATNVVTANITLTARWSGGATPIAAVAANDIPTSFTYINANAGTYSLLINRDINVNAQQTLNFAQRHLTIVGLGGERKITISSSSNLFLISNLDASLTIDENITLTATFTDYLVYVQAGNLTMQAGSKINSARNAVYVTGVNSSFIMGGGEISGNNRNGVFVTNNATFIMSGGKITGNGSNSNNYVDVTIDSNAGIFTLSGNAEIGTLTLNKADNGANASITIGTGGYTGIVSALNLHVDVGIWGNTNIQNVVDQWTLGVIVPTVIKGVTNANILNRFTLGNFISNSSRNNTQNISPDYRLELVGSGEAKLVWR